ncbi:Serine/threonine-protein kinase CTR1 [Acorus calamus]|uniref:Serine/threonine-protein kinase CTR1 n=1 Tax=Acorus calamus TaxID=4465 RepID=A0AAV9FF01_ACOCL|nr:Serine/threonine-protein kinase CTR1 [Acorus calamus]
MAVDQTSLPKDLRPLNLNRTSAPPPARTIEFLVPAVEPAIQSPRSRFPFHPAAPSGQPASPSSSKKVKFLCSFGGKILPRPSDGALRYVGGQTRIVSVRRDVSFREIVRKMTDVYGGGGGGHRQAVAIKYQLPDEDLDALVSVSGAEDLENMMEEYEKLPAESKLRVFLFPPQSDPPEPLIPDDGGDIGQRYVEAVNGAFELRRKDSVGSGLSTQNSDGPVSVGDAFDGFLETNSSAVVPIEGEVVPGPFPPSLGIGESVNVVAPPGGPYVPVAAHGVNHNGGPQGQLPLFYPVGWQWHQGPVPVVAEKLVRLEDCYMCQTAIPHAHSDTVIHKQVGGGAMATSEPLFHSVQSDEALRSWLAQCGVVPEPLLSEVVIERKEEHPVGADLVKHGFQGVGGVPQLGAPAFSVSSNQPTLMAMPLDVQASYGMHLTTANLPQNRHEHSLHQPPLASSMYQMNPVNVADVPLVSNGTLFTEPVIRDPVTEFIDKHPAFIPRENVPPLDFSQQHSRPVNSVMGTLHVNPPETFNVRPNIDLKPESLPKMVETLHVTPPEMLNVRPNIDLKPENPPVMVETFHVNPPEMLNVRPNVDLKPESRSKMVETGIRVTEPSYASPAVQIAGRGDIPEMRRQDDTFVNPAILHPAHFSQVGCLHHLPPGEPSQMAYQHFEPRMPEEVLYGKPVVSCANSAQKTSNKVLIGERKNDASQFYSRNVLNDSVVPESANVPSSLALGAIVSGPLVNIQEPASSGMMLLSDAETWKMLPTTNFHSTKPVNVVYSTESLTPENHLGNNCELGAKVHFEGGGHRLPSNFMTVDRRSEAVQAAEEEQIKQELQAVAEGVAASVLQSCVPPVPVMHARPVKEPTSDFNKEKDVNVAEVMAQRMVAPLDNKIEENKAKLLDKATHGLQITEDISRLQIIKNSDLEELRELGSGTFGTVYHGKWRGSDVAIKRINDRCFAGKKSEQERLRADFWNEACKLADLHHPNVVAFYGVVLDGPGGSVATVTEYMVNGSLRNALQKNDKILDRRKRLVIAMDVAFGMEYLHSKNIVHFDLKSDNLLVNLRDPQRPICKVGDLGLSKVKCQTLISGGVRGTLPWMAPELLNGSSSRVSEKVDVFSFGIVMWELLTGEEPYADLHYGAIIGGIVNNTLRPPVPELCDPEWRSLMEQCWSPQSLERPSFTEIASRLRSMEAAPSSKGQHTQSHTQK